MGIFIEESGIDSCIIAGRMGGIGKSRFHSCKPPCVYEKLYNVIALYILPLSIIIYLIYAGPATLPSAM